jgi:eukaryotic-like serine/threonine-protein kinase
VAKFERLAIALSDMPLALNSRLGRYEIRSQVGAGGMGEVYLACDPKLGREVDIKVLLSTFSTDRERLARFEQEAQAPSISRTSSMINDGLYNVYQRRT